jgi:REP element-mobilizing transposase RayT
MYLSEIGQIASDIWLEIPGHFPIIDLDEFVVMPDHIHGIIVIKRNLGNPMVGTLHATSLPKHDATHIKDKAMSSISPKFGSLAVVVRSYKSEVTKRAHNLDTNFSWQPRYYDTIICTTWQLSRIRKYISDNVQNWNLKV